MDDAMIPVHTVESTADKEGSIAGRWDTVRAVNTALAEEFDDVLGAHNAKALKRGVRTCCAIYHLRNRIRLRHNDATKAMLHTSRNALQSTFFGSYWLQLDAAQMVGGTSLVKPVTHCVQPWASAPWSKTADTYAAAQIFTRRAIL